MTNINCFTLQEDVVEALKQVPHGEKSRIVNEALRMYFELNPTPEIPARERKTIQITYPASEITINDL